MTTYFSDIFNMTSEIVTHTDDIIDLIMIAAVIAIVGVVVGWLKGLFKNMNLSGKGK